MRYWDGQQWTPHVAPGVAPGVAPASRKGMSGGTIAALVFGVVAVGFVVVGILAAIAIPVFLDQKEKEADAAAKQSLRDLANQITTATVDNNGVLPSASSLGSAVELDYADTPVGLVALQPTIGFGGLVGSDGDHWCVWVSSPNGSATEYQYSTWGEFEPGSCSP